MPRPSGNGTASIATATRCWFCKGVAAPGRDAGRAIPYDKWHTHQPRAVAGHRRSWATAARHWRSGMPKSKTRPKEDDYFLCRCCGAELPATATFCGHCGASDECGWGDDHQREELDLPAGY